MVRNTNNNRVRKGMELIEKRTDPTRYLEMIDYVRVQKRDLCIRRKQVKNNNGVKRMKTTGVSTSYVNNIKRINYNNTDAILLKYQNERTLRNGGSTYNIAGFVIYRELIDYIYIDVICAQQGYGSGLIDEMIRIARLKKKIFISLNSVKEQVPFYRWKGFQFTTGPGQREHHRIRRNNRFTPAKIRNAMSNSKTFAQMISVLKMVGLVEEDLVSMTLEL